MAPSADVVSNPCLVRYGTEALTNMLQICFSACKDDETSADTFKGGVAVGAMSNVSASTDSQSSVGRTDVVLRRRSFAVLVRVLLTLGNRGELMHPVENNTNQTYEELLAHLREILIPEYDQKAQISCTHPLVSDVMTFG